MACLPALPDTFLLTAGSDRRLQACNTTWQRLGYREADLLGRDLAELIHPEDSDHLLAAWGALADDGEARFAARLLCEDGTYRLLSWEAIREETSIQAAAHESALRVGGHPLPDAYRDLLTGLPNRELFLDRLGHTLERAKRRGGLHFAVMQLGVDRFQVINDSLGHRVGDMLLAGVARTLENCVRPTDTVARLGGDEFAILLEDIQDVSSTLRVAQRVQEQMNLPFLLKEHEVFTNMSVGIVVNSPEQAGAEDYTRDANIAMQRAKHQGGAAYVVFDKGMHDQAVRRMHLELDLRRALERKEFQAYYQPIIALSDGRLTGFEALVRWLHPEQGLVSPAEFIPVAEETGLVVGLGLWMLREACMQTRAWQEEFCFEPPLTISVNLSPRQLRQDDLVDRVREVLEESGLEPQQLKLEITESAVLENTEKALELLHALRAMSVPLCLDDFGTGYSSLSYLHQLPVDVLKIDRSFVCHVDDGKSGGNFVETIVELSHSLDLEVVAEGVETASQEARIREMGCEYGQGYLYSRPVNSAEARILIAQHAGNPFGDTASGLIP